MEAYALDWVRLILRWVHVVSAIAWIGPALYFAWADDRLEAQRDATDGDAGAELRVAQGSGFYAVRRLRGAVVTTGLHGFKWEAYWTWLSGFALLIAMYYLQARAYLVDPQVFDLSPLQAIGVSVTFIVAAWLVYDQLCKRLGPDRERAIAAATTAFFALAAWALSHLFSGRGLYIQVGAMLGTIMVANVAHAIVPAQRRLVEASERGAAAEPVEMLRAKQRSVHNSYLALPVVLIMISNHAPATYGHRFGWLVLIAILLLAASVRHFFVLRQRGRVVWAIPVAAALAALAVATATAPAQRRPGGAKFGEVRAIVAQRCAGCHAEQPTQAGFAVAPKDFKLDTPERILTSAPQIYEQAVVTRVMPIGNLTGMTESERATIAAWMAAGAAR